jgi:hypothetical protein
MSVDPGPILHAELDHAHALGVFDVARLSEFKSPPPPALCFALWVQQLGPAPEGSGLASTTGILHTTARLYMPMWHKPESDIEIKMASAASGYLGRLNGALTLGGLVRNVDMLAEMGQAMAWQFGYVTIDNKLYRIADLQIYAVLNDAWDQAA